MAEQTPEEIAFNALKDQEFTITSGPRRQIPKREIINLFNGEPCKYCRRLVMEIEDNFVEGLILKLYSEYYIENKWEKHLIHRDDSTITIELDDISKFKDLIIKSLNNIVKNMDL